MRTLTIFMIFFAFTLEANAGEYIDFSCIELRGMRFENNILNGKKVSRIQGNTKYKDTKIEISDDYGNLVYKGLSGSRYGHFDFFVPYNLKRLSFKKIQKLITEADFVLKYASYDPVWHSLAFFYKSSKTKNASSLLEANITRAMAQNIPKDGNYHIIYYIMTLTHPLCNEIIHIYYTIY